MTEPAPLTAEERERWTRYCETVRGIAAGIGLRLLAALAAAERDRDDYRARLESLVGRRAETRTATLGEAARLADSMFNGFHSPWEYSGNVADAIRALAAPRPTEETTPG